MHLKKFTLVWALLALMLGQITLAEHSASHIDHGFSQESVTSHHTEHNERQHEEDNKKHECPECLLTKSLQAAFYHAPVTVDSITQAKTLTLQEQFSVAFLHRYKAHSPRAPPAPLI